jgi:hypothetical protein
MIYIIENDVYVFPHSSNEEEEEEEDMLINVTIWEIQFTLYHIIYIYCLPKTRAELIEWLREAERYCAR